jgi:putative ABC transport system permease protein
MILRAAIPWGETRESIQAALDEELDELRAAGNLKYVRCWQLREACKLAIHFGLYRLKCIGSLIWTTHKRLRGKDPLDSIRQDLRFALRMLRRRTVYGTVAVLTLGLGIGAVTTMFSVVDAVLIQSVPFREPDRLANVWVTAERARGNPGLMGRTWDKVPLSLEKYRALQASNTVFEGVAVHNADEATLTGIGPGERIALGFGSASLASVLGVMPVQGRWFLPAEEGTGNNDVAKVAVVSFETWRDRLGSDPDVLGRPLILDGVSHTIVGVMPEGFRLRHLGSHWAGEDRRGIRDAWVPIGAPGRGGLGEGNMLEAIVRLRPDVNLHHAVTEARQILLVDGWDGDDVRIVPRSEDETQGLGSLLILLLGATGLLLLIGCANVATLALAELQWRWCELSIRAALGAGRGRIIRQLLVESLVLGSLGSLVGVILAYAGTDILVALAPPIPRVEAVGLDHRVLAFAVFMGILAATLVGALPALLSARVSQTRVSNEVRVGTSGRKTLERSLVSIQFTFTVVLLVSCGLLMRSLHRLLDVDPGFDPEGLATVEVYLPDTGYQTDEEMKIAYDEILSRISAIPGVTSASAIDRLPFPGGTRSAWVRVPATDGGETVDIHLLSLSAMPGYHDVMGIPLVMGDDLPRTEAEDPAGSILISEDIARRYWPGSSPIGIQVYLWGRQPLTIVGVVGDVRRNSLGGDIDPAIYGSLRERRPRTFSLLARTDGDAAPLSGEIRDAVRGFDEDIPLRRATTMSALVVESTWQERYLTMLMTLFGVLAALLAAGGIFGQTTQDVARRSKEMGIRMSLGAEEGGLVRAEMQKAFLTGLFGTVAGLVVSIWAARLLSGLLFGINSFDALTYGMVAGALALVSLWASYLPARRITSLDPARILRAE